MYSEEIQKVSSFVFICFINYDIFTNFHDKESSIVRNGVTGGHNRWYWQR